MSQATVSNDALSLEDKALVDRVRNLFEQTSQNKGTASSLSFPRIDKAFNGIKSALEHTKDLITGSPGNVDLNKRFDWSKARRTADGVRVPGVPSGRADALLLSSEDIKRVGRNIAPGLAQGVMAFGNIEKNILLIPDPKDLRAQLESAYKSGQGAPDSETGVNLFSTREPISDTNFGRFYKATVAHEICHLDNDFVNQFSKLNSEVTCYDGTIKSLVKSNDVRPRTREQILGFISGGYVPQVWARDLLILTDGKFNRQIRTLLPGGEKFSAAMTAWIARTDYELLSLKGSDRSGSLGSKVLFEDAVLNPKQSEYSRDLKRGVAEQLSLEFDAKGSKIKPATTKVDYINGRIQEFQRYLDGESDSFSIDQFRSPKRTFPEKAQ